MDQIAWKRLSVAHRADRRRVTCRLGRLLHHRIAPGELDIRGWLVATEDGHRVGRVFDVIVDMHALLVAYIEVALDASLAIVRESAHVVVPIGCARVAALRQCVNIRGATREDFLYAPYFGRRRVGDAEDSVLRQFFLRQDAATRAWALEGDAESRLRREQREFWGARANGRIAQAYLQPPISLTSSH